MKTKGLIYIALLLVIMNLLSTLPALANDEHMCPHHALTISSLRMCVVHASDMGHITNQGVMKSLLVKLDAAQAAQDRNQNAVTVAKLEAFIHEVEAQAGKHIDASHAEHMIMHAGEVIDALKVH